MRGNWVSSGGRLATAVNLARPSAVCTPFPGSRSSCVNIAGARVSGYDDTSSYHSPADAADPPAASAEPPAAPGPPAAAAGSHAPAGNRPSSCSVSCTPGPTAVRPPSPGGRAPPARSGRGQRAGSRDWAPRTRCVHVKADPADATRAWAWRAPDGLRLGL